MPKGDYKKTPLEKIIAAQEISSQICTHQRKIQSINSATYSVVRCMEIMFNKLGKQND